MNINDKTKPHKKKRTELAQMRHTANVMVGGAATSAAVAGAVPILFPDTAVILPIETMMTKGIFKTYKINVSADLITAIIGSAAISNIAKSLVTPLKVLPIAGQVINGVVAGAIVLILGEAEIALSEAIHKGGIKSDKMDDVLSFVDSALKKNKIVGELIKFIEQNATNLAGKDSKEILTTFLKVVKKIK